MKRPKLLLNNYLLHRVDAARNMARFYAVSIEPNLWGEVSLVRRYGRIHTRGRVLIESFQSWGQAETRRAALVGSKLRRGYRPVS